MKDKIPLDAVPTIISRYRAGETTYEIAKDFGVNPSSIGRLLKRRAIRRRRAQKRSWIPSPKRIFKNTDAISVLAEKYRSGLTTAAIAREFGVDPCTVQRSLIRSGYKLRNCSEAVRAKFPVNEACFDEITEEAAYWIGFIAADGNISDPRGPKGTFAPHLTIALAKRDESHLRKFLKFAGAKTHRITPFFGGGNHIVKGKFPARHCSIGSWKIVNRLAQIGLTPRKSLTVRIAGGLENNRHFWRGVVDGDGSLGIWKAAGRYGGKCAGFCLVGSRPMMKQFERFLRASLPDLKFGRYRGTGRKIDQVSASGVSAGRILQLLYRDSSVSLDRKRALLPSVLACAFRERDSDHKKPTWKTGEEERRQMMQEYRDGLSLSQLAALHGLHSPGGLGESLKRWGLKLRPVGRGPHPGTR